MILLDTHILIWMALEPDKLSRKARQALLEARSSKGLALAAISLWELAWIADHGRVQVTGSVEAFVRDCAAKTIIRPITPEIAALAARLPAKYPKDPQDRLIAATALAEGMPLVTADKDIRASKVVPTIW